MAGQVAEKLRGFNSQLQQTRQMVGTTKNGSKRQRVWSPSGNLEFTLKQSPEILSDLSNAPQATVR